MAENFIKGYLMALGKQVLPTSFYSAIHNDKDFNETLDVKLNGLTKSVSDEVSRAKSSENSLSASINAEVSRAKSAESSILSEVNTETNRAIGKETEILSKMNLEVENLKKSIAALNANDIVLRTTGLSMSIPAGGSKTIENLHLLKGERFVLYSSRALTKALRLISQTGAYDESYESYSSGFAEYPVSLVNVPNTNWGIRNEGTSTLTVKLFII